MHDDPDLLLAELITAFPRLFKGAPPRIPGYVAAGWHPLLMQLFNKIDELLDDGEADQFRCAQIKEKFGGLRVYVHLADHYDLVGDVQLADGVLTIKVPAADRDTPRPSKLDAIHAFIEEAATVASSTCEVCGAHGRLRSGGWIRTLCDEHAHESDAADTSMEH